LYRLIKLKPQSNLLPRYIITTMQLTKKILASTKNIHFQSLLGNGITAVFGLAIISILYRSLSTNDIDIYVLFLTIFGFVDTFRSGFLTFAFIKFYTGTNVEKAREIAGSAWCLALLITAGLVVINVIVLVFSAWISDSGDLFFLKYFSWVFLAGLPFFMGSLIVQGEKRFDRLLRLKLVSQILFAAFVAALAISRKTNLNEVLLAYVFSNLASSLVAIFCGWTRIGTIKYATKKTIAELFHFGKYSLGTNLSATLFRVTDVFFLKFLGEGALAVYFLGGRLTQIVEIPLGSFVGSGMPLLSDLYNKDKKDEMMLLMKKMVGMVSIALVIVALVSIVFADPIIMLIGGKKFINSEAPNLFRIFMSLAIFYPADRFFAVTLDVIHKPKINFHKILVMLAINLIADYIGLTFFKSVYAIALANIFPSLAAIIIAYIPINKYASFNFWNMYVEGFKESILLIKSTGKMLFGGDNSLNKV